MQLSSLVTFPSNLIGKQNLHYVLLNGAPIQALIDTGSQVSIMNEGMYKKYFDYLPLQDVSTLLSVKQVNGESLQYIGAIEVYLNLGRNLAGTNTAVHVLFLVIKDQVDFTPTFDGHFCLIGMNALEPFWQSKIETADSDGSKLDPVFAGLTRVFYTETELSGRIGVAKAAEEIVIHPGEEIRCKARFHSKLVGVTSSILVEPEVQSLMKQPGS